MNSQETTKKVEHLRSHSFYFARGDVVLGAPWDQYVDTIYPDIGSRNLDELWVYFRVEMSQLRHHSPVFADMFALPTPSEEEKYDGLPLVRLPDEGHAVEELLKFIYCPQ